MGERRADNTFRDQIAQPGFTTPARPLSFKDKIGPGMSLGEVLSALMKSDFQKRMAQRKEMKR